MTLIDRAREFVETGDPRELTPLLLDCVASGTPEGKFAAQLVARDDYGGDAFGLFLKAPALYCLLAWGQEGIKAAVENASKEPTSTNFSLAMQLLSSISEGHGPKSIESLVTDSGLRRVVLKAVGNWSDLSLAAHGHLRELMLRIDDDNEAGIYVSTALMMLSLKDPDAIGNLSHALAQRTIAVGPKVLAQYGELLAGVENNESVFQQFLERHPLLLDPRAFQVWGKPDLHGKLEPDFVIRTYDDNYVIVEIETPSKLLITKKGNLSAGATHAIDQILEYQHYLVTHIGLASEVFPRFSAASGLVVVGMESSLNSMQKEVLRRENHSRSNIRIVGFDTLANSSRAATNNVIHGISKTVLGARLP